jgi:predicted RNase H-like nuclease (RuvC/YqgF family)
MDDQRDVLGVEARNIAVLITRLRSVLLGVMSWDWEREYRCNDLAEKVWRLEEQLKDIMPYGDWPDPPSLPRTALDAADQQGIEAFTKEIFDLRQGKRELEAQIQALQSQNWELGYKCSDLGEQVDRLKMQLQSSVALDNVPHASTQPKTAMERALEKRVRKLEGMVRNLTWTAEHGADHPESAAKRLTSATKYHPGLSPQSNSSG